MSQIRFNHVFTALLLLSILSAFVLSPKVGDPARAQVQNIFAPVALPARKLAAWVESRFAGDEPIDRATSDGRPRALQDVLDENERLRLSVGSLTRQLDELKKLNADRQSLGEDIRKLCTPFAVMGGDSGRRQSLSLLGSSLDSIRQNMPVLYPGGIAGAIDRAGVGGAQVKLVTDRTSRIRGSFARFERNSDGSVEFVPIAFAPSIVHGDGEGAMVVYNLDARAVEAAGIKRDDWAVLQDGDWPLNLQGYRLGRVTAVVPSHAGPLFRDIRIEPARKLMALREVMVMNK